MDIDELNDEAVDTKLNKIIKELKTFIHQEDGETKRELLKILIEDGLENSDDFFGTEGYRRYFNI